MTTHGDDVPEADLLDQLTPTAPEVDDTAGDEPVVLSPRWDADPTDAHEQATPVDLDDDAYPHHNETNPIDHPG